jgi:soluble lytic murein transglycosylase
MKLRLLYLLLFALQCSIAYCEEIDGKAYFKQGKDELNSKRYEAAILSLSVAEKEFPLLGDYASLWLSDAYHEIGNHGEALKTIRTLLKKYPDSPLRKKARIREIEEAEKVSEENIQQMFQSFIKDYPKDTDLKYAYAQWLKKNNSDVAKSLFREICTSAGHFSELACKELGHSDIRAEDLIERASNLMGLMDFKGAESALRSALEKDNGSLKNGILKGLGLSLFKQKKYSEAAEVYEKANEVFWKASSLYRAGEKEALNSAIEELLKIGDRRASLLLVAIASDKRRDGEIEEALKTYQNVLQQYPSEAEDALWGIGWTYFLTREYEKAADVFTKLCENYNNTRYLYWKARSIEASGKDALDLYQTLRKKEKDFYSAMSYIRTGGCLEKSNSCESQKHLRHAVSYKGPLLKPKKFDRAEVLFELGLSREALLELIHISKATTSIEDIQYIGSKFQDLGEYKYLVSLTERLPYGESLHYLRYPYAYWDTVEAISGKHCIDPLLVLSVMREESTFNPDARSSAGALGLMQLMPQTAFRLDSNLRLGITNTSQVYNIKNNIHLGTYYLSILIKEFGSYAYALAAYNAGEEKVRRWIQKGNYKSIDEFIEDIPYAETRNYVKRVMTTFFEYRRSLGEEEAIKKS